MLEDDLSEAVRKRILRGPRLPSHKWPVAQVYISPPIATGLQHPTQAGSLRRLFRATPTKPHPRGSGRGCRRRSCSFGECSGSSWRRESVGETVVGSSESGKVTSECPCQCADRNVREVFARARKRLVDRQRGIGEGSEKKNSCTSM